MPEPAAFGRMQAERAEPCPAAPGNSTEHPGHVMNLSLATLLPLLLIPIGFFVGLALRHTNKAEPYRALPSSTL
jgi:hypothetical protein